MTEITGVRLNKFELKHADTDDPIAAKVSWNPVRAGGASFKTHKLKVERTTISVGRSTGLVVFGMAFTLLGMLPVALALSPLMEGEGPPRLFIGAIGAVFVLVGLATLRGKELLTFDKVRGVYFRGGKYLPDPRIARDRQGRLADVHAIQLITETVSGSKGGSYQSHELNLVLKDGERLNVMDHGNRASIEAAAKQLAEFIDVPIWQAVY